MATPTNAFPDNDKEIPARPAPWKGSLVAGVGCCSVSVLLMALDHRFEWREGLMLAVGCQLLGAAFMLDASRRWYGTHIEQKFVRKLRRRAPAEWLVQANVPVPGCGDADTLVQVGTQLFAVEIKSQRAVIYNNPLFGRESLTNRSGRLLQGDPIKQSKRVATAVGGCPVLWYPLAHPAHAVTMRCGVLLVFGGEKILLRAITRAAA